MWSELLNQQIIPAPVKGQLFTEEQAMRLAIQEAFKGTGRVSPNPQVGCVVLNAKNEFLSSGYHAFVGGDHAEVMALKKLSSDEIKSAQFFVTLEPCAHEGRTPSCAKTLSAQPIKKVVYGLQDPNPLVAGQGAEILKKAGIEVQSVDSWKNPNLISDLEATCEHFLFNFRNKKPFVSVKVASSLDGQLALKTGESKWITSEAARLKGHELRYSHDALVVGKNTVLTDDPSLDIRLEGVDKKNKIVILDSKGEIFSKPDLKIFKVHKPENIIVFVEREYYKYHVYQFEKHALKAKIIPITGQKSGLDFELLLNECWSLGLKSLLIEGGAAVLSSVLSLKLANRLYLFQAPVLLGAKSGKAWSEAVNIHSMPEKIELRDLKLSECKPDYLVTGLFN